jgi:cytochrome P450
MVSHPKRAPGPWRWSPFGSLSELRATPLETLLAARETYGDVVRFRVGLWSAYLLSHPDDVKHVLQDNHQNYRKGFTFGYLKPLVGSGLLTAEGESWRIQRRLIQPAFHHRRLDGIVELMAKAAEDLAARWLIRRETCPVDVVQEMTAVTLQIVSNAILGVDLDAATSQIGEAIGVIQEQINWRITHLFFTPDRYPTPRNLKFRRSLRILEDAVFSMIEMKRIDRSRNQADDDFHSHGGHEGGNDVLSLLLEAQERDPASAIPDLLLRDEVMTFLLAGNETTANALAWTCHFLALNPEAEERLHSEVDSVLHGRRPALADLSRLRFTRMVFEETLRLRPPVWALGRFSLADDQVGRYRLSAYSSVLLSPYVTHRHPEFWEIPERFDPDRFRPEQVASRPGHAYFPFGAGPRMCIGREFAIMEAVVCLATIAGQFKLRALADHSVEPEPLITLRPKGGMPMYVETRSHFANHDDDSPQG